MTGKAHSIEITIMPNGKIKGEIKGIKDTECGPLSKWLDELGRVTLDKKTPDWYKQSDYNLTSRR